MLKLIIYKDKITATQWKPEIEDWIENDIKTLDSPITKYFNRYVFVKEDVTVEDFLKHLEYYEKDIDFCFSGYNNDVPLRLYLDDMRTEIDVEKICVCDELEMVWQGEILSNTICVFGNLLAFLSEEKAAKLAPENNVAYNVNYLSINSWKHCKFVLNDTILINNLGSIEDMTDDLVFEGYHFWTLFDIISSFLSEITMNGTPEERNKTALQIANKDYDVKEVAQHEEQANFWLIFLESELEEMQLGLSEAEESEEYEQATVLKKDIDVIKKELKELKYEIKKYKKK
jgi:hypothetical protein